MSEAVADEGREAASETEVAAEWTLRPWLLG